MAMDFKSAAILGTYISKDYAENMFKLLVKYKDISASEAASRLGLHIRTAQDFLEAMTSVGILSKEEVYERKRPYFRYSLEKRKIAMEIDLDLIGGDEPGGKLTRKIRERKNSGAGFNTARSGQSISSIAVLTGEGRERKERKINLTAPQGRFLYHLPFPNARHMGILDIMKKAEVDETLSPEIIDIVDLLEENGVIDIR